MYKLKYSPTHFYTKPTLNTVLKVWIIAFFATFVHMRGFSTSKRNVANAKKILLPYLQLQTLGVNHIQLWGQPMVHQMSYSLS